MRVLKGRVVVKELDGETKTDGGLIVADSQADRYLKVEVVAVGADHFNGKRWVARSCDPGDTVYIRKPSRPPIDINGLDCHFLTFEDILVVKEDSDV